MSIMKSHEIVDVQALVPSRQVAFLLSAAQLDLGVKGKVQPLHFFHWILAWCKG